MPSSFVGHLSPPSFASLSIPLVRKRLQPPHLSLHLPSSHSVKTQSLVVGEGVGCSVGLGVGGVVHCSSGQSWTSKYANFSDSFSGHGLPPKAASDLMSLIRNRLQP